MTSPTFRPVFSTEAMREADRRAMEEVGIPGRLLMETAGRGSAAAIETWADSRTPLRRVLVLCGTGNNGGDGFVVARALHETGRETGRTVHVVAIGEPKTDDARANLDLLRRLEDDRLSVELRGTPDEFDPHAYDLVIDALLGLGVSEPPREPVAAFVRWMNAAPALRVALDMPTGLDSETGEAFEPCVEAGLTCAMAALKPGHVLADGPRRSGHTVVVPIGLPPVLAREASEQPGSGYFMPLTAADALLPSRREGTHKYEAGRVVVIAGSRAFPGAAVLTSRAAARAGAGAVTLITPASARSLVAAHLVAEMSTPAAETDEGTFAEAAVETVLDQKADAVVIGPGLGRHDETRAFVRALLARLDAPVVLDADGLVAFEDHTEALAEAGKRLDGRLVVTPHEGEFARLAGDDALASGKRMTVAAEWAAQHEAVLLLKGEPSLVAPPRRPVLVAEPLEGAMATAGTGDVLAGCIGGFLAMGLEADHAAAAGLMLGAHAARHFGRTHALTALTADALLDHLGAGYATGERT